MNGQLQQLRLSTIRLAAAKFSGSSLPQFVTKSQSLDRLCELIWEQETIAHKAFSNRQQFSPQVLVEEWEQLLGFVYVAWQGNRIKKVKG